MKINVCCRKQTFLWRTKKDTKAPKTEIRISPAAYVINRNRTQGDLRIWNISMRSPQVRVFSKTCIARSCWFGCWSYFLIFASSQSFHLVCTMGLKVVCWDFWGFFCLGFFSFSCNVNPDSTGERSEQLSAKDLEEIWCCVRLSVWHGVTNLNDEIMLLPTFLQSKT